MALFIISTKKFPSPTVLSPFSPTYNTIVFFSLERFFAPAMLNFQDLLSFLQIQKTAVFLLPHKIFLMCMLTLGFSKWVWCVDQDLTFLFYYYILFITL